MCKQYRGHLEVDKSLLLIAVCVQTEVCRCVHIPEALWQIQDTLNLFFHSLECDDGVHVNDVGML